MSEPAETNSRRHPAYKVVEELGLVSLYRSTKDVKILCAQRFIRLFAYGGSTLVLVAYLRELGVSTTRVGLFMTLTLVGDIIISFLLALFADGVGRRAVLALGAILMTASGIVFATSSNYWILLAAAIFGVISPGGNEIGPFRGVEESIIAHLTDAARRGDVYAWYSLSGTAGGAFGLLTCGWIIHHMRVNLGIDVVEVYRSVFYGYSVMGVLKLISAIILSSAVEVHHEPEQGSPADNEEQAPLLPDNTQAQNADQPQPKKQLRARISRDSIPTVVTLCTLLALDSFASGLAPLSWITYYFKSYYHIEEGKLGSIFFTTSIIAAASMLVASSLAKRFGNVRTMVFTHLPSAVFLALVPIPNDVHLSVLFLILRSCTQSMDVAPRSAFLAAIIKPKERTVVIGLINVAKTTSQSLGPLITGLLADSNYFWVSFIMAGSLKVCYDLGFLGLFKHHEHVEAKRNHEEEGSQ
ncbi:multidrug resistance transporter protein [Fusarium bulbicola]|nr:multidrug resistance transporter protein [Fusarium bulbicola]